MRRFKSVTCIYRAFVNRQRIASCVSAKVAWPANAQKLKYINTGGICIKILVACECSQKVTIAFRAKGHEAYSCDIQPCYGGHPEWHIQDDVLKYINGKLHYFDFFFVTSDGACHELPDKWDMVIAFPPCTDLASSGARHFEQKRKDGRQQKSIDFFLRIVHCDCPKVIIENPVGIMSTCYRKPDQIIQPWQFGHGETKATCLWLRGVPCLVPTNIVSGRTQRIWRMPPSADRTRLRSETFEGIAQAMAQQWG